ncbi:MAG: MFS family permease [Alphaproteobacteria bacterium]|jgi:MFS family permease
MIIINPLAGFTRAMRHRDYRLYTIGSVTSLVGTWVQRVALGWLTWEITHSYAWLGIIAFADLFAMMIFAPLAGDLSDRMDRLKLSIWAQVAMLIQAISMFVVYYSGYATIWVVLGLTIMLGIMHSYHSSARLALVPNMVPHEDLVPAIAINSIIFNIGRFIGPAAAGLVIVNLGVGPAFMINALTFVVFLYALLRVRIVRIEHQNSSGGSVLSNIAEGVRYSMRHAGIGPVLIVLFMSALTGRAIPDLLPGFADGVFKRGAEGLAWLATAMGLGATISGFFLLTRDGIKGMTNVVYANVALLTVSAFAFATSGSFWAGIPLMALIGFSMNNSSVAALNLMQNAVDGAIRGRVMSIYTVIIQGAPALGTLLIGAVAEATGLPWPVAIAAIMGLVLWAMMLPRKEIVRSSLEIAPPNPSHDRAPT